MKLVEVAGMDQRICRICQQAFTPRAGHQMFCSRKCNEAARKGEWATNRKAALARDSYRCQECGSSEHLEVHHIQPLYLGGTHALPNLQTLCYPHHRAKHRRYVVHEEPKARGATATRAISRPGRALLR